MWPTLYGGENGDKLFLRSSFLDKWWYFDRKLYLLFIKSNNELQEFLFHRKYQKNQPMLFNRFGNA